MRVPAAPLDPGENPLDPGSALSVVDRIKRYILVHRMSPGDALPTENELSDRLGVSRSRLREAMKTLSALDIVEVRHGYGTYVGRMSLTAMVQSLAFRGMLNTEDDQHLLADLIDVRQLIEVGLVDLVIDRMVPEVAQEMRRLTETMREKAEEGTEFGAEDRQFHLLLLQTTGNALAVQLNGAFWDVHALASSTLAPAVDLRTSAGAHAAVLEAIERRDPDLLRQALLEHYAPIRQRMSRSASAPA